MAKKICCAGNMIVDVAYSIDAWPSEGRLAHIYGDEKMSCGGSVCNTATDIARLVPEETIKAVGCIGTDARGDFLLNELGKYPNFDLSRVKRHGTTSFTYVMNSAATKERSFFTFSGGDAEFTEEMIDWDTLDSDMLHVAYIMLLPALDAPDPVYGTRMARLLAMAKARGVGTSIDVVSESGGRPRLLVPPALKYTDHCVINELEAESVTGVRLRATDGSLITDKLPEALQALRAMGAKGYVAIHCPEGSCGLDKNGKYVYCPSLRLPEGYIKGTVGAGDAFCAGFLTGISRGEEIYDCLAIGTCAAAASLGMPGASEGVGTLESVMKLKDRFGTR